MNIGAYIADVAKRAEAAASPVVRNMVQLMQQDLAAGGQPVAAAAPTMQNTMTGTVMAEAQARAKRALELRAQRNAAAATGRGPSTIVKKDEEEYDAVVYDGTENDDDYENDEDEEFDDDDDVEYDMYEFDETELDSVELEPGDEVFDENTGNWVVI